MSTDICIETKRSTVSNSQRLEEDGDCVFVCVYVCLGEEVREGVGGVERGGTPGERTAKADDGKLS